MTIMDFGIAMLILLFVLSGWKNGLVKKLFSLGTLFISLFLATKAGSAVGTSLFADAGASPGTCTLLGFIIIVIGMMIVQGLIYHFSFTETAEKTWNKVSGALFGLFEGGLILSLVLILSSLYLKMPSEQTKTQSALYRPILNFAPTVFDTINTFFPESKDFYEEILFGNSTTPEEKEQ